MSAQRIDITDLLGTVNIVTAVLLFLFFQTLEQLQSRRKIYFEFIFLLTAVTSLFELAVLRNFSTAVKYLYLLYYPSLLAFYPLIYCTLKRFVENNGNRNWIALPKHFFVSTLSLAANLIFYASLDEKKYRQLISETMVYNSDLSSWMGIFAGVITFFYYEQLAVYTFLLFRQAKKIMHQSGIATEKTPLLVFYMKLYIYGVICFEAVFLALIFTIPNNLALIKTYELFLTFALLLFLGYVGSRQLLIEVQYRLSVAITQSENEVKPFINILSENEKNFIKESIINFLLQNKAYLDPNFKLEYLAKKLHLPAKKVSYVINTLLGKNFHQLLNEFRINAALEIIGGNEGVIIDEIYQKVGFNSRSTFNRAFKEFVGKSPSEYLEEIKKTA